MAERDLRGAVISRKNSQCSKNDRGADTFAKMKSIFETLRARKLQVIAGSLAEVSALTTFTHQAPHMNQNTSIMIPH